MSKIKAASMDLIYLKILNFNSSLFFVDTSDIYTLLKFRMYGSYSS